MKPPRLAVIGFGRLGRACAEVLAGSEDLRLAGIVRRAGRLAEPLPAALHGARRVSHLSELGEAAEGALICVPGEVGLDVIHDVLQHRIPIVECASFHSEAFWRRMKEIHHMAMRHRIPALVGAGWNPGALSIFRGLFALLAPKGHTEIRDRPGHSLHHDLAAKDISGVKDALSIELPGEEGKLQRYVYVELEDGADAGQVSQAVRRDPLFLGEEILVFPVESMSLLEDAGHGVIVERRGTSGPAPHPFLLLEARHNAIALAAEVMVAAARALPAQAPGAHSLLDIPLSSLTGRVFAGRKGEWV